MINVPIVNFRYRGPKESLKLVTQVGGAIADLDDIFKRVTNSRDTFDALSLSLDAYASMIDRARIIADFIRRTQC